jgi:D-tyrosyl-tRNA(Tyr) deacylase
MIALIQRVTQAEVRVADAVIGRIDRGILALIGVQRGDDEATGLRLLERLLTYRIFPDDDDKMNLSLRDIGGGLLLVPQFTLAADTRKGTRPGFSAAAAPAEARRLFEGLSSAAQREYPHVAGGLFGAHMQISLVNDGPVTFWLTAPPPVPPGA